MMKRLVAPLLVGLSFLLGACTPGQVARYHSVVGGDNSTLQADADRYNEIRCQSPDEFIAAVEDLDLKWLLGDEELAPCPRPTSIPDMIRAEFGASANFALAVARCESGLNPRATGAAAERGIFQIHPVNRGWLNRNGFTWSQMYEAGPNIRAAALMWRQNGWGPWTCARLV